MMENKKYIFFIVLYIYTHTHVYVYIIYIYIYVKYIYTHRTFLVAQLVKNLPAMQETLGSICGLGSSPGEGIGYPLQYSWASLVAQTVKNTPAIWETWV